LKASAKVCLSSAVVVAAIAGAWILYTFPPATTPYYPRCVFHAATGLSCPGCGTTRALHHLLHGRIGEAFAMNALLFALLPAGLVVWLKPAVLRSASFAWGSFVVLVAWWVGRNV
jgi:hypothetical protein